MYIITLYTPGYLDRNIMGGIRKKISWHPELSQLLLLSLSIPNLSCISPAFERKHFVVIYVWSKFIFYFKIFLELIFTKSKTSFSLAYKNMYVLSDRISTFLLNSIFKSLTSSMIMSWKPWDPFPLTKLRRWEWRKFLWASHGSPSVVLTPKIANEKFLILNTYFKMEKNNSRSYHFITTISLFT